MHPTTRRNLKPLGLLAAVVAVGLLCTVAGGKGKPPKDDPPPEPSLDVGYWLTVLGGGLATSINDEGVVVGFDGFAFRVIPDEGVYYRDDDGDGLNDLRDDLNDLGVWVDHEGKEVLGWTAVAAYDINERGAIVGVAEFDGERLAFVLIRTIRTIRTTTNSSFYHHQQTWWEQVVRFSASRSTMMTTLPAIGGHPIRLPRPSSTDGTPICWHLTWEFPPVTNTQCEWTLTIGGNASARNLAAKCRS